MTAHRPEKAAVGSLSAPELALLCTQGRSLQEIGDAAGVTRERVRQILQRFPHLAKLRTERRPDYTRECRMARLGRWRASRHGRATTQMASELAIVAPELAQSWRETSRGAWSLYLDGKRASVLKPSKVSRIGSPDCYYRVYRGCIYRAGAPYAVMLPDGRRFLYLAAPGGAYLWWEAEPPWRRYSKAAPDFEWRGR